MACLFFFILRTGSCRVSTGVRRYHTERTAGQWKTLLLHMRTRAQIPAGQAKAILKYLQEDAGK